MRSYALRPSWSDYPRFVIAISAAVVSLSNIWRLPYLIDTYGGGAFLLVYGIALLVMGLPLFSAQLLMARGTRANVASVIARWAHSAPYARLWVASGYLAVVGAGLLLAAYCVVASWSLAYSLRGVSGMLDGDSPSAAGAQFVAFARDPERGFGWLFLFVSMVTAVAARGVRHGVEPVLRTLAFCMLMALTALCVSAVMDRNAWPALSQLVALDLSELKARGVCEALYQAFFTLSLGSGVVVSFGSYLPGDAPVIRLSVLVLLIDLAVALVCAFVLGVFVGASPATLDAGVQSLFTALPVAFEYSWQAPIVFVLIALVSLSTAIGLFEPLVQLVQQRADITRVRASLYCGLGVGCIALLGLLSFSALHWIAVFGYNLFDWLMLAATQLIGPLTGLLFCILVGRVLERTRLIDSWRHVGDQSRATGFALWHMLLRYPTRIVLIVVLAYALGTLRLIELVWYP